jgi:hypothetical protein
MKKNIQYENENEESPIKKKMFPTWLLVGGIVFLIILWILAISIEQALHVENPVPEPRMLVLSYFSYNIVLASVFCALLGAFCVVLILIFGKIFFVASLFFSFIFIVLMSPFIIPFFVETTLVIAPKISYKHELIKESLAHEEKIKAEIRMKEHLEQKIEEMNNSKIN